MIFAILILGFILRLISLDQSLWLDEATSVLIARDFSISEILTKFSPGDFHPPLYYLMLKVWIVFFGSSEVVVRLMSVMFGIATVYSVYLIARALSGKVTPLHKQSLTSYKGVTWDTWALLSAALLAIAPLHIYYSQEARMYVPATFFASVVGYFVVKITANNKPQVQNLVCLTIASAALLYTDYLPIFLLASFFTLLVIYHRGYLGFLVGWVIATMLFFIPWFPTFISQFQSGLLVKQNAPLWWETLGRTNLKELILVPVKFMIGRISAYDKVFYASSVALASLPFSISFVSTLHHFAKIRFLWFWFLLPIIFAAIFGIFISGFSYFRLLFVLPAFYLLVAFGSLSIKNQHLKKVVLVGVLTVNLTATGIYLFNPRFHREDWRSAVAFIEKNSFGSAATVFVSKNQRDPYHYYSESVPYFGPEGADLGFERVWLVRYVQPIFDPEDKVRRKLEENGYKRIDEQDFNGVVVWRYEK